jgi:DNA polymerase alpha subunit A
MAIAKRKREEDREKKEKIANGINKYFTAKSTSSAPKPKVQATTYSDSSLTNLYTACGDRRRRCLHGRSPR